MSLDKDQCVKHGYIMASDEQVKVKKTAMSMGKQLQNMIETIEGLKDNVPVLPFLAVVDPDKCIACGVCIGICPADAIGISDIAYIEIEKCKGCGHCVTACPQSALSLHKR